MRKTAIITATTVSMIALMFFGSAIESGPAALIGCGVSMVIFGICGGALRQYVDDI